MITDSIDFAQVILYVFWVFFFGLVFWLRREDRREGYPLESGLTGVALTVNGAFIPPPKTFILPNGAGSVQAPNLARDRREINATGRGGVLTPNGDPMLSGVGPASYAMRHDTVELMHNGDDLIVPLRIAPQYKVNMGPDPRGFAVVAGDGKVAGTVKEIWLDRADVLVRYLEVELAPAAGTAGTRLVPITMLRVQGDTKTVDVVSVLAAQFAAVPTIKEPNRLTVLEEEKISAYFAGGRLYAEPKRQEPLL